MWTQSRVSHHSQPHVIKLEAAALPPKPSRESGHCAAPLGTELYGELRIRMCPSWEAWLARVLRFPCFRLLALPCHLVVDELVHLRQGSHTVLGNIRLASCIQYACKRCLASHQVKFKING